MISFEDACKIVKDDNMKECVEYENAWWFLPNTSNSSMEDFVVGGDLVIYKEDGHVAPFADAGFDDSMGEELRTFRL